MKKSPAAMLQTIMDAEGMDLKAQQEALHQALSEVIRKRQAEQHKKEI